MIDLQEDDSAFLEVSMHHTFDYDGKYPGDLKVYLLEVSECDPFAKIFKYNGKDYILLTTGYQPDNHDYVLSSVATINNWDCIASLLRPLDNSAPYEVEYSDRNGFRVK